MCSKIDGPLSDAWFKMWIAMSQCDKNEKYEMVIFKIDEKDCIKVNSVDLINSADINIENASHDDGSLMIDYAIKEIPEDSVKLPVVTGFVNLVNNFAKMAMPEDIYNQYYKSIMLNHKEINKNSKNIYDSLRISGIMAIVLEYFKLLNYPREGSTVPTWCVSIMPSDMNNSEMQKAEDLLSLLKSSISNPEIKFTYDDFNNMHDAFIKGLDIATTSVFNAAAKVEGIERNSKCPCGSGKKYKQCHGRFTKFEEWLENPTFK